jgi:uncharacterized membrane-anchored protein YitT (DUF2179 family)/predicted metal-dependent HD superfamily phosphohydrolase
MQFDRLYQFVINKLQISLPSYLTYHNAEHTRQVISNVELIASHEQLSEDEYLLVKTGALLHDTGFLQSHENHEELSCNYARKILPEFGYSHAQIDKICDMIYATRLPQTPHDLLSKILCDADLFYLGDENYAERAEKLESEMRHLHLLSENANWVNSQIQFLTQHRYFTPYAISTKETGKQSNLAVLKEKADKMVQSKEHHSNFDLMKDIVQMILGVTLAAIALKGFLMPNHFFDGGITGIALLLHETTHQPIGIFLLLLNLPLMIAGYYLVGLKFSIRMALAIVLLVFVLQFLPNFTLTNDKLLISIFGGVFIGTGVGLVMRSGAALDGIEVAALYTLKRTSFTITEIIMAINIIIFSIAALKFGIESALYSILTYFAATRCIDYVVEGIQAYMGVTIISSKSEMIKYQLVNKLGKGITIYKGERGFLPGKFNISNDCDIIFTVVTRLELRRLKNLINDIDPAAFVFANSIRETMGGVIKRIKSH